jgi:S-(hydroxymethyl)glutathione dehydrogenase / alcohol dehydrogenase
MEVRTSKVSRRSILQQAAAISAGAAAGLAVGGAQAAQAIEAPAIQTGTQTGRRFRAFVVRTNPPGTTIQGSNAAVEQLTLKKLDDDRVVVRTEAAQVCYTITGQSVGNYPMPRALGHGAVGIVEAVGAKVQRVRVGDRVIAVATPACGQCYTCLRGRADRCQFLNIGFQPYATLADGTDVIQHDNTCGFSELMVPLEWACVPVPSTHLSAIELAMLADVCCCGLGTVFGVAPVEPASDVAVLGCGPVGLSAIQGARIRGASQIIAVDPIRVRRELALRLGATVALDPNVEGMNLVEKVRGLCEFPNDRRLAGGRDTTLTRNDAGPDYVVEAVGGESFPPKAEAAPDPTGLLPLQQAWELCSAAGHLTTVSGGQRGNFTVPAARWSNGSKNHHSGNMTGTNALRDIPRFVRLADNGQFDVKSLATSTFPLERAKDALQIVADRLTIAAVLTFSA